MLPQSPLFGGGVLGTRHNQAMPVFSDLNELKVYRDQCASVSLLSLCIYSLACDFVSCLALGYGSFHDCLVGKSRLKRKIYSKYIIPDNALFPLPFGRTNVVSQDVFDFCSLIGRYFLNHVRAKCLF